MAFNPDEYLKRETFDPDAYLKRPAGMDVVDVAGAGQAALESFGNAATLGYLPQLQAAVGKLMPNPTADVDADLAAQGFKVSQPEQGYLELRDENLARQAQQKVDFPNATKAGTVAGIAATALVPAGVAAKGATLAAKAAQGAKVGAVMGAVANPGDVEGEIAPLQLEERSRNAALGGALGAAGTVAVEGGSQLVEAAIKGLRTGAAKSATRALGRPKPTQATDMARSGEDVRIGRELLDEGAIPILGTPGRIAKRVEALREESWKVVDDLLGRGGDSAVVDGAEVGLRLLDDPAVALLRKTPGAESTVAAIESAAETFAKNGKMSLRDAQALKKSIDEQIRYGRGIPDLQGKQEALFKGRTALRDQMDDSAATLDGVGQGELKAALKHQGTFEKAADLAEYEAGRVQANQKIGLTDVIAGTGGVMVGDTPAEKAVYGALGTLLNKGRRSFGASLAARSQDAAAKLLGLSMPLTAYAKANPLPFQAAAQRMFGMTGKFEKGTDPVLDNPEIMLLFEQDPRLIDSVANSKLREQIRGKIQKNRTPAQSPIERRLSQ